MRNIGCKINGRSPVIGSIKGTGKRVTELQVFIKTEAETGVTPKLTDLKRIKVNRQQANGKVIPELVSSVDARFFQLLNNYLAGYAGEQFTAGANVDTGYNIPFDILPMFRPGKVNGIMLEQMDSITFEQASMDSAVFKDVQMRIYKEESATSEAMYAVRYHQIPYDCSTASEQHLGHNLTYLAIFPPTGGWADADSEPGMIMVKDGETIIQRFESWDDAIIDTMKRGSLTKKPEVVLLDIGKKGLFVDEISNNASIEILEGSGNCTLVKVNVTWTPEDMSITRAGIMGSQLAVAANIIKDGGDPIIAEAVISNGSSTQTAIAEAVSIVETATIETEPHKALKLR